MIKRYLTGDKTFYLFHPITFLKDLRGEAEAFIQRGSRGYADEDLWGLDEYLSSWLPSAIHFYKTQGSCPLYFFSSLNPTQKESRAANRHWNRVLRYMEQGFLAHKKLSEEIIIDEKEREELERKATRGLRLFSKHYNNLWY